jgi:hypothetical protein
MLVAMFTFITVVKEGIVGVWTPLDFFQTLPLAGSSATHMLNILGTLWTVFTHEFLLGIAGLDIYKVSIVHTGNLHDMAVAA